MCKIKFWHRRGNLKCFFAASCISYVLLGNKLPHNWGTNILRFTTFPKGQEWESSLGEWSGFGFLMRFSRADHLRPLCLKAGPKLEDQLAECLARWLFLGPHQLLASCLQEASLSCPVKLLKGLRDRPNDMRLTSLDLIPSSPSPSMRASLGFYFPALDHYWAEGLTGTFRKLVWLKGACAGDSADHMCSGRFAVILLETHGQRCT